MPRTADADRRHLAAYLARHGATPGKILREDLGWSAERFWNAAYGPAASAWVALGRDGWAVADEAREHAGAA